ncbi:MAG: ligase-associated DNA damage response endonuclease PdeM [Phycisphaerae bacterium]|nr:ligase-associated DNA damage response endonuclease PdeM [Phycisphaerae bacterium]
MLGTERVELLPERAVWWEGRSTLLIADLHLGKTATFRARGIPAPEGTTRHDLLRLSRLIERLAARRVVILGDMIHSAAGRSEDVLRVFSEWRAEARDIRMLLVRGNHDRHAGDPPREWGIECVDGPHIDGSLVFRHEPGEDSRGHVLCGHVHPAARLVGRGDATMRVPCFWVGKRCTILPAFGSFTGAKTIHPRDDDRVFAAGESVIEVKHALPSSTR